MIYYPSIHRGLEMLNKAIQSHHEMLSEYAVQVQLFAEVLISKDKRLLKRKAYLWGMSVQTGRESPIASKFADM